MTEAQLLAAAARDMRASTISVREWMRRARAEGYPWEETHIGEALLTLEKVKRVKSGAGGTPTGSGAGASSSAPPSAPSIFSGKGLFTTSVASSASGLRSDWVAVQKDPEGDPAPAINNNPGRLCYWQARPTQAVADIANARGIPYIGQAENEGELAACLALDVSAPKAIIGNPTGWPDTGFKAAAAEGWDLICEWYWNKHPWETAPNANNYPRFVNVCFGFFSEAGTTPKSLEDYRAVWTGSFSVWCAEQMTPEDRKAYNA